MPNWNRQYRFRAYIDSSNAFEIGEPGEDGRAIHINFQIERSDSETLNSTKIKLWNLNSEQIGILSQLGCTVEISAGYGNSMPVIFKGTVTEVTEELDGADRLIQLEAVDGFAALTDKCISMAYGYTACSQMMIDDITERLGVPITYSESAQKLLGKTYFYSGFSYVGYIEGLLDQICETVGLVWNIENGVLQIRKDGEGVDTYAHILNRETGLLKIPKKIYETAVNSTDSDSLTDEFYGYEVEYLMNGAICVGDVVKLESGIAEGTFIVASLSISGDNYEGSWTCTAKLVETVL